MSKSIKTRVQNKHDLEVNWNKATFISLPGELYIYDKESNDGSTLLSGVTLPTGRTAPYVYERFKVGDGVKPVKDLPFSIVSNQERLNWNTAYNHSQASHAPSNAEKNQNAFSTVAVSGQTSVVADAVSDTLTLAEGSNVTITTDASNDKITIAAADTHYTSKNVVGSSTAVSNTTSALANGNVYLNSVENGAVTSTHKISGFGATAVTSDVNGNIIISSTDNDTHYKATPHAGSSSSTSAVATTNGNTYINIVENGARSGGINIKGSGATTVTSDANGVITIASTDNNTTYSTATSTTSGLTKLYAGTGTNTDGTMTQGAITSTLSSLISSGTADPASTTTSQYYFKYSE